MGHRGLFFDGFGEQHVVDAVGEFFAIAADGIGAVAVEFGFDLARMRRQQQDAVADQGGFRD